MIIKDAVWGEDHILGKTRLSETIGHASGYPYYCLFSSIRITVARGINIVRVVGKDYVGGPNRTYVTFDRAECRIGCRTFSPTTFAKILKAAGVKKTKTAKGKK